MVWVGEGEAVAALWLQIRVRMPKNCWVQAELESSWLPYNSMMMVEHVCMTTFLGG